MKKNIILVMTLVLASCCTQRSKPTPEAVEVVTEIEMVIDTVYVPVNVIVRDTVYQPSVDCFIAKYKLERIQRYIDITDARPANRTFFYGWIKRVMDE